MTEILHEMFGNNNLRKEVEQYKNYYSEILVGIHTDLNQYKQLVEDNSLKVDKSIQRIEKLIYEINQKLEIVSQIKKDVEEKEISIKEIENSVIQKEELISKMLESINSTKIDLEEFKITSQSIINISENNSTEIKALKRTNKIISICFSITIIMIIIYLILWK